MIPGVLGSATDVLLAAAMLDRLHAAAFTREAREVRRRARLIRLTHAHVFAELLAAEEPDAAWWAVLLAAALHEATEAEVQHAVEAER